MKMEKLYPVSRDNILFNLTVLWDETAIYGINENPSLNEEVTKILDNIRKYRGRLPGKMYARAKELAIGRELERDRRKEFSCAICDKTVSVLFDSKSVEETICPECLKQMANAIWFNQDSLLNEESSMYNTLVNYVELLYKRVGKNEDERLNFLSSSDFECSDEFKNLSFGEFVNVAQEKNEELIIKLFEINEIDIF